MPKIDISYIDDNSLHTIVELNSQKISSLWEFYGDKKNDYLQPIIRQLKKTYNRSSEFKNSSFIVLIVGPVKSGKSTFVNLLANAYVSPTHFLECTVRPSIITHHTTDHRITIYTSQNTNNKVEQFDSVIDCLRGLEQKENIPAVTIEELELTDKNINSRVMYDITQINNDATLTTTITTPGGELLQENVFITDMPGIDGKYASIDNPIYDVM